MTDSMSTTREATGEPRTTTGRELAAAIEADLLEQHDGPEERAAARRFAARIAAIEEEAYDEPAKATDAAMNYGDGYLAALTAVETAVTEMRAFEHDGDFVRDARDEVPELHYVNRSGVLSRVAHLRQGEPT